MQKKQQEPLGQSSNGLPIYPGEYIIDVTMPAVGGIVRDMAQLKGASDDTFIYYRIRRKNGELDIISLDEALKIPRTAGT